MKEIVKHILIVCLFGLGFYHIHDLTNFTRALFFNCEYLALTSILIYLATIFKGKERWFFGILSTYFGLKMVYNTLLYITPIGVKLGLYNSEFWGFIFTGIIIICLIVIQYKYVKEER